MPEEHEVSRYYSAAKKFMEDHAIIDFLKLDREVNKFSFMSDVSVHHSSVYGLMERPRIEKFTDRVSYTAHIEDQGILEKSYQELLSRIQRSGIQYLVIHGYFGDRVSGFQIEITIEAMNIKSDQEFIDEFNKTAWRLMSTYNKDIFRHIALSQESLDIFRANHKRVKRYEYE